MNESCPYRVPAARVRSEILVVNSRFITTVVPVHSVDEARAEIHVVRQEMPDANHHVYGFRVGHGNSVVEGMSDDGEPTGTSGPPVLAILRGSGLGDILVIVTRYFGGTKLGTGGLVRAYSDAARAGLALVPTEPKIAKVLLGLELPYPLFDIVKRLIDEHAGKIQEQTFDEAVLLLAEFPQDRIAAFTNAVRDVSAGRVEPVRFGLSNV